MITTMDRRVPIFFIRKEVKCYNLLEQNQRALGAEEKAPSHAFGRLEMACETHSRVSRTIEGSIWLHRGAYTQAR